MITRRKTLRIQDEQVEVLRKDIKHLHLAVYPPDGRVRVSAPLRVGDEAVRLAVISRIGWIRRRRAGLVGQFRQSARELVSGESHYVAGGRYLLRVSETDSPSGMAIRSGRRLDMWVRKGTDLRSRQKLLDGWYRERLRAQTRPLLARWCAIVGATPVAWGIKRMKTRWGTCNPDARRVWINLELAKKPAACLEYIVVHELVHLLERRHNARFSSLMDEFLPGWRTTRDVLNHSPLAHEDWDY